MSLFPEICNKASPKTRAFTSAPLPFIGQKRHRLKLFLALLQNLYRDKIINKKTIFVDVFGGSGLVAHNIKCNFPNHRVIWNDFDNYAERLSHIDETNAILSKIAGIVVPYDRFARVSESDKQAILSIIDLHAQAGGYVDFITLSANLLFSGNIVKDLAEFEASAFYLKSFVTSAYNAEGFLNGVERVSLDFVELLESLSGENVFYIFDPPYFRTESGGYSKSFGVKEFLTLLSLLQPPYILFSSNKSGILDFMKLIRGFENIEIFAREEKVNFQSCYQDYLIVQRKPSEDCASGALLQKIQHKPKLACKALFERV